jgi:hypothetical protein
MPQTYAKRIQPCQHQPSSWMIAPAHSSPMNMLEPGSLTASGRGLPVRRSAPCTTTRGRISMSACFKSSRRPVPEVRFFIFRRFSAASQRNRFDLLSYHYSSNAIFTFLCGCLLPRTRVRGALPANRQHTSSVPLPLLFATQRALSITLDRVNSVVNILHRCSVTIPSKHPRRSRD